MLTTLPESVLAATLEQCENLDAVTQALTAAIRETLACDGATIVLRDGDQCHYVDEDAVGPLWKGRRFPLERCISGWSMLNRVPVAIGDIKLDPRIPFDAYRPTFVKSLAMTPVRPSDPLGALGAYWAKRREPTADDLANLRWLAAAAEPALSRMLS